MPGQRPGPGCSAAAKHTVSSRDRGPPNGKRHRPQQRRFESGHPTSRQHPSTGVKDGHDGPEDPSRTCANTISNEPPAWQYDHMLSGTCAFCGNRTHFTARAGRVSFASRPLSAEPQKIALEVAATCDGCYRFNTAKGTYTRRSSSYLSSGQILDASMAVKEGEAMTIDSWSPPAMHPVDVEFLPEAVAGFLKEAHDAFSVGAHRAVLLLVRSVIEAAAKDKGVTEGKLLQKINTMANNGLIREGTKDMAHVLRILGNDMAHGDIDQIPTQEDADDALIVARFVLDDVYVADARRKDMLARRGKSE